MIEKSKNLPQVELHFDGQVYTFMHGLPLKKLISALQSYQSNENSSYYKKEARQTRWDHMYSLVKCIEILFSIPTTEHCQKTLDYIENYKALMSSDPEGVKDLPPIKELTCGCGLKIFNEEPDFSYETYIRNKNASLARLERTPADCKTVHIRRYLHESIYGKIKKD